MAVMNSVGGVELNRRTQHQQEQTVAATETRQVQIQEPEQDDKESESKSSRVKAAATTNPNSSTIVVSSLNSKFSLTHPSTTNLSSSVVNSSQLGTLPPLLSLDGQESKQLGYPSTKIKSNNFQKYQQQQQQQKQGGGSSSSTSNNNNIIYPFTYSLISAACSPCIPYRSEISRTIDTSSSIFYTVPLPKPKSDLLGTPSILKPSFRQLEEPTRFITALSKAKLTSTPNIYTPPIRPFNNNKNSSGSNRNIIRKKQIAELDETSSRSTPATESVQSSVSSEQKTNFVPEKKFRKGSTMPLRVRMRRDEYYYTDTSSKATQTDDKELTMTEKRRKSSGAVISSRTDSGRLSGKVVDKIDRSTSPITPISSAEYLKKIEDLEKITGHFIIQRFFTRTDQNFVDDDSRIVKYVIIEPSKSEIKSKSDEIETDNVPFSTLSSTASTSTATVTAIKNSDSDNKAEPTIQQSSSLVSDENEIIDETQQLNEETISSDVTQNQTIEYLDELEEQIEQKQCQQLNQGSTDVVILVEEEKDPPQISDEPRPNVLDEIEDEVIEDESPIETVETIKQQQLEQLTGQSIESLNEGDDKSCTQKVDEELVEQPTLLQIREKQCKLSDAVTCECFAKFFLHEESIAKLLISLSPRTSTPITNTNTIDMMSSPFTTPDTKVIIDPLESFEKFEAALQKKSHNDEPITTTITTRHSGKKRPKIKHSGSLPCGNLIFPSLTVELDQTITVMSMAGQSQSQGDQGTTCGESDSNVFPFQPHHLRHIRKSNSVDSCLGTDFSSIKTTSNGGSTTSHPLGHEKAGGGCLENLDISQDSHSQAISNLEDLKASIEEEIISNKDSGLGGSSRRSNWYESTDLCSARQESDLTPVVTADQTTSGPSLKVEETRSSIEELLFPSTSSKNNNQKGVVLENKSIVNEREIYSADSDTESEIIMSDQTSENYHARSEAESDTEDDTDGDAVADGQNLEDGHEDNTDDDKDNALLARMELGDLNLDSNFKPLIRTTCTQTNRSLFSSAWSNASSASTTTNGSNASSYIDLEVVSKKLPTGSLEGQKRNYLPSSSSSLNFVNCSMNFSMNMKSEESKIKMSVSLPGNVGATRMSHRDSSKTFIGRPSIPRKLQALHSRSVNDKDQRDKDLPSLWANVRNRLDSKVSLDAPASSDPLPMVRGDGILGESIQLPNSTHVTRDDGPLRRRPHERSYQRPQHQHQHSYLQSKVQNDDRIKRSLQRLSKLLDK